MTTINPVSNNVPNFAATEPQPAPVKQRTWTRADGLRAMMWGLVPGLALAMVSVTFPSEPLKAQAQAYGWQPVTSTAGAAANVSTAQQTQRQLLQLHQTQGERAQRERSAVSP
jgi:hypothetical protein